MDFPDRKDQEEITYKGCLIFVDHLDGSVFVDLQNKNYDLVEAYSINEAKKMIDNREVK